MARGTTTVTDILNGVDMLTSRGFGPLIGASHETVNIKRKRSVYRFLRTAHAELSGRTALDALKAGQVDGVVAVAGNQASGTFA